MRIGRIAVRDLFNEIQYIPYHFKDGYLVRPLAGYSMPVFNDYILLIALF